MDVLVEDVPAPTKDASQRGRDQHSLIPPVLQDRTDDKKWQEQAGSHKPTPRRYQSGDTMLLKVARGAIVGRTAARPDLRPAAATEGD